MDNYITLVAVNNFAVSFLENDYPEDARALLKCAVVGMTNLCSHIKSQRSCKSGSSPNGGEQQQQVKLLKHSALEEVSKQASNRLRRCCCHAKQQQQQQQQTPFHALSSKIRYPAWEQATAATNTSSLPKLSQTGGDHDDKISFAIRMNGLDGRSHWAHNLQADLSIVLYNYCIVHRVLATAQQQEKPNRSSSSLPSLSSSSSRSNDKSLLLMALQLATKSFACVVAASPILRRKPRDDGGENDDSVAAVAAESKHQKQNRIVKELSIATMALQVKMQIMTELGMTITAHETENLRDLTCCCIGFESLLFSFLSKPPPLALPKDV